MIPHFLVRIIAEGGVWFDPKVSLGSLIISFTFLGTALFHWRDVTWKIKNTQAWQVDHELETREWRTAHERESEVQKAILGEVRDAVFQLKALTAGQERRLTQLEDRPQSQRGRDRSKVNE